MPIMEGYFNCLEDDTLLPKTIRHQLCFDVNHGVDIILPIISMSEYFHICLS